LKPDADQLLDVIIIGGGQAGLAVSRVLQRSGVMHVVLDAHNDVGDTWCERWDSLTLFTPARYSSLPDLPFPAPGASYPSGAQVAAYLASYAGFFNLPVELNQPVRRLASGGDRFVIETPTTTWSSRQVVIATGAFGRPWRPPIADQLDGVKQLHASEYRRPADVASGQVLVVGAGNTGVQLALELANAGRHVQLAGNPAGRFVRQRLLRKDLFWWLSATGAVRAPATTLIGRRLRAHDPVIGTTKRMLRAAGVERVPRVEDVSGPALTLADGTRISPNTVIWATGYRHDDRWIEVPEALNEAGVLRTEGLRTPVPGLFVIGRPWQRNRGSALLGFVGEDAEVLVDQIANDDRVARREPSGSTGRRA
jgi:putative flavoprotein involved in K+ transport